MPTIQHQQEQQQAKRLVACIQTLLDQLPPNLFTVTVDQRFAVERLLITAGHSRSRLPTVSELLPMIGPILCGTPEQQVTFHTIAARAIDAEANALTSNQAFDDAASAIPSKAERADDGDPETDAGIKAAVESRVRRGRRARATIVIAFLLVLVVGLALILGPSEQGAKDLATEDPNLLEVVTPSGQIKPLPATLFSFASSDSILRWLLTLGPLLGAGLLIGRRRGLQRFLEQRSSDDVTGDHAITLIAHSTGLFGEHLRERLQPLRSALDIPTRQLDVPRTLRATIRQLGYPDPRFAVRRLLSEYLLISRTLTDHAHLDYIGGELVNTLRSEEFHVRHYTFWREGVRLVECRRGKGDGAPDHNLQDLTGLAARFPDHRLIVVDEARYLIDRRGAAAAWAQPFHAWSDKVWLTPTPRASWGMGEAAAKRLGFEPVALSDEDPLVAIGSAFTGLLREPETPSSVPLPHDQLQRFRYPMAGHAADPHALNQLVDQLEAYLGNETFLWLQACAVYPRLQPGLTDLLGHQLEASDGGALHSLPRFARLSRLPWFQDGEMPEPVRHALIERMDSKWRDQVRDTVIDTLKPLRAGTGGAASIQVIRRYRRQLIESIIDRLRSHYQEEPHQARLLIDFLKQPDDLALPLPHRLFRGWRESVTPDLLLIAALGIGAALTLYGLYDWIALGAPVWVVETFANPARTPRLVLAALTGGGALALLAWWLSDLLRGIDGRGQWPRWSLVASGLTALAALLSLGDSAIMATLLYLQPDPFDVDRQAAEDARQIAAALLIMTQQNDWKGWPNLQLLLALLAFSVAWLRAFVPPALEPRIAAPSLYESILRTPLHRIAGRLVLSFVVCGGLIAVLMQMSAGTALQPLLDSSWPYPFTLPFGDNRTAAAFLRPILLIPLVAFGLAAGLQPALAEWKPVGQMVIGGWVGALFAESAIEIMIWLERSGILSLQTDFWIEIGLMPLTPAAGMFGALLALHRYQMMALSSLMVFNALFYAILIGVWFWISIMVLADIAGIT